MQLEHDCIGRFLLKIKLQIFHGGQLFLNKKVSATRCHIY